MSRRLKFEEWTEEEVLDSYATATSKDMRSYYRKLLATMVGDMNSAKRKYPEVYLSDV